MEAIGIARVLVAQSPDGTNDWTLVKPEDVPAWLNDPKVMGTMLEGHLAHDAEDEASPWYCAIRVPDKPEAANEALPSNVTPIIQAVKHVQVAPTVIAEGGIPIPGDAA